MVFWKKLVCDPLDNIDLANKLANEIEPKYTTRQAECGCWFESLIKQENIPEYLLGENQRGWCYEHDEERKINFAAEMQYRKELFDKKVAAKVKELRAKQTQESK